jgi:hypothetical protein
MTTQTQTRTPTVPWPAMTQRQQQQLLPQPTKGGRLLASHLLQTAHDCAALASLP